MLYQWQCVINLYVNKKLLTNLYLISQKHSANAPVKQRVFLSSKSILMYIAQTAVRDSFNFCPHCTFPLLCRFSVGCVPVYVLVGIKPVGNVCVHPKQCVPYLAFSLEASNSPTDFFARAPSTIIQGKFAKRR